MNLQNFEIIQISTEEGKLVALLSYQDVGAVDSLTDGYHLVRVPVNIRELQLSIRDNILVNQSVRQDVDVCEAQEG